MLESEFCTKKMGTVDDKISSHDLDKELCITCARVLMMVVSGDGCGGSSYCGDKV
jgi:hypothetical protein